VYALQACDKFNVTVTPVSPGKYRVSVILVAAVRHSDREIYEMTIRAVVRTLV